MSNKGVITKGIYRKALTALAMMMVMSVVFAFTFTAQTHRIHAGTVNNIDSWAKLKTAIANAPANQTTTIKITKDLVALEQLEIKDGKNIRIESTNDQIIYRHSGNTDFSVFKVTSGELDLGEKITMTGKTAKVKQDRPGFDAGGASGEWKVYWNIGYGTDEYEAVESTANGLTRGKGLSHTIPDNLIPEGYYFVGWRIKGFPGITGEEVLTNAQMANRVKVPATGGGLLRVKAKWAKQTNISGSTNITAKPKSGKPENSESSYVNFNLKTSNGTEIRINDGTGTMRTVQARKTDNSGNNMSSSNILAPQMKNIDPVYLQLTSNRYAFVWRDNSGQVHLDSYYTSAAGHSYYELTSSPSCQWYVNSDGVLVNKQKFDGEDYALYVPSGSTNGAVAIGKLSELSATGTYANKWWNDGTAMNDGTTWTNYEPAYTYTPAAPTVDGTEIDTDTSDQNYSVAPQDVKYWNGDAGEDTAGNPVEKFSGKISGATNDQGFFVQVENGGKLKISGATLEEFNTVTIDADNEDDIATIIPKEVAPVYVKGELEMTGGTIQKNAVGYVGIESKSNDNVRNIQKYLGMKGSFNANGEFVKDASAVPMTNTAGGVIFTGENAKGTISGGIIGSNKGDAGGIIVTNKAFVTLNNNGKINGNLGFHHAGAVLVDNGGTLNMQGGEMANNVTWAKGGAVWATQWGTNGYVVSDWRKWPKEYPEVKNPTVAGEHGNFIMNGGTIHDNTAFIRAGAIEVESNGVELYKGQIYDNNCRSLGGAIYVEGDAVDYSYTLYVKQGYIGNNMSVTKDSTVKANGLSSAYNNKEVNIDILDRYLDGTGKLSAQGTERGKTYDPDFYGALGNGGGVWLCPVGGTSVFAKDGSGVNKVTIDNNQATRTGTDFYLHKGNGSVMVQNLQGKWYEQKADGTYKNPGVQKTFAGETGTVLRGMLAMKNDAYTPDKTAEDATNDYHADTGIMIYNNKSRDGGGIACNGTLMLGGPSNVYRHDARIEIAKKWDIEDSLTGKTAKFRIYLKNENGTKGQEITDPQHPITLDGRADNTDANTPNVQTVEGETEPTTEGGKPVWNAGMFLPTVVELPDGSKVQTYVFNDPTSGSGGTLDLTKEADLERLRGYLANHNGQATLTVNKTNFIIEEDGNEYDMDIEEPYTVVAEAKQHTVKLKDPVTGLPKEGGAFYVTFSQTTFKVKAVNKDKPVEVPVRKTWLRSDGFMEISKKSSNNSGDAYYNWPSSGPSTLTFTLSGGASDSTQNLTKQQVEALIAGNTTGLGNNVEITNATGGLASRELVYKDGQGKVLYKVGLERKDYAMYFIGDELIYAEPYEGAKTNAVSYTGDTEEEKIKAYIADKAQQELDSVDRSETASASNVKLGDADKRVLFPKLIFLADKNNSEGQAIEYTVTENDVTGYRKQVARVGETNAFTATNTSTRIDIPAVKKWVNRYNVAEATKKPNGLDTGTSLGTKEYVNWPASGADSIKFALAKGSSKYNQVITAEAIQKLIKGDATGLGNNAEMLNADQAIENRSIVYTRNAYTAAVSLEKKTYRAIFIGDEMIYGEEESECRENTKAHFNVDTDLNPTTHWVDYIALNAKRVMDAQHRPYTYSDVNDTTVDIGWAKADTYTVYVPKVTYTVTDGNYTFDEPEVMNGTVNVKNNGYKVTTSGDKTTIFTATNKEDRKDIYATKEWKDKKGNLILTQTTGNNTDFSSILNGNKYLNWPGSGVNWIRLKIESTAAGAGALDTHIDIDVKDLEDILVRNSLRSGKASSTVKFHADTDVEKRYIEYLGSGANAGKTIARLAVKKTNKTVNGQDVEVYTPIVRFVVDNDGDYNVVETGMNTESGGFGKYNVTYDQTSNPRVITNAVDSKEIPANKTWLDANGVVMATKKPNGLDWTNSLQTENGYLKFINWPESGVSSYVLTLSGGTPATRNYTISLTDIKPLVTGNESDMTDASAAKKFNGGDNIEDRYIEWNDNRGTAKLSLKKQEYFIVYDINGNIVYAEPKEEAMEHTRDEYGSEYHSSGKWEADYMIAKAKEKLVERGMTQAEADRLVLRGSHGGEAKPENGFVNYGEKVYLYTPVITYIVEGKNDQGSVINYTLDETAVANYDKSVTGSHSEGFDVSNRYNKVEISATKKWIDYNDNVLMTQSFGSHQFKVNGESVWVNWPSANTEYVRVKLEDKAASPAWSREDTLNANTIKDYLANPNNSWPAGRGTALVKFDKKNYYVVLDKDTNEVVLTVPTSDVSYTDETEAHQYVTSLAVNKTGKKSSDLKVEERLVYFPKVVYNINRNSSGTTLAQYVITELGVGSGEYSATDMRTDDYFPTYYKNNGTEFDPTDNITDATKHMGMMEAGITICNERKVNVKLTKKWRSGGTEIPMPPGVTAEFQLMKYDEKQKKFVDVTGNDAKKTLTSGSTLEWTGLEPGRYAVRESGVPDSYVTDMPTDGTAEVTITKNSIGQDVFEYTATNKELTTVEAEKKWNGSTTWPSGISSVNLYLKRWYRYDSFGNPIWQRILNDTTTSSSNTDRLYIDKPVGTKKYVTVDSNTNKYYVKDGDKNYDVINNGYVEIDGMIYALQGGKLVTVSGKQYNDSIIRDHNDDYKKVLVDPKNKEGIAITSAKALKNGQKATWTELPKYDDKYPVHDGLTEAKKKEIRKIEYWALEETPSGYLEVITCSENGNKFELTVNNTKTQFLQVEAQKVWDDGNSANRPTIRFELWRQTHSSYSGWQSGTDQYWSKLNGSDKYGQPYDRIITSESNTSDLTQRWVKLPDSETKSGVTYSYNYAPREALLVGQDKDGKDVYVYVNSLSRAISNLIYHDAPYNQGVIEVTYNTSTELYTINVWALNSNGQKTDILIDGPKTVKTLDKRAIDYQNGKVNAYIAKVDYSRPDGSTVCWAHDMVVRNTRPAIEKYVNQDVHQDLQTKEEIFTYDIMAYVPEGSKEVKIYDPLVKALEFVDKNGKGQSQSGYKAGTNLSNVVEVAYMDTNNHKAISVDANGSVTQAGTKLATNQYTATISRKPTNGSPLGSTDDATYKTNLESYINLTDAQYENKLTVTLPESTLSGNTTGGKWVKVTFKAKIRDDIDFANLEPTQRQKLGFETISKNDPVQTNITNHTGFKNKASYDVKLGNNYKYENIPSNEVTVVPPTSLKVEKKVTGTLGDVNKEFVFKIEMTGLQNNGGEKDPSTKRDYYYGASVNGADGPKAYMDADLNDSTHRTYNNGFNVNPGTNVSKTIWVKLKAGQSIEIKGLPVGATYKVTESASDHVPTYNIKDANTVVKEATRPINDDDVAQGRLVKDGDKWIKATADMVGQSKTVALNIRAKDNAGSGQELATAQERVDAGEDVTITYTNHRDIETQTGIIKDTWPWNIILLVLLILLAYDDQMRKIKNRLRLQRLTTTV